MKVNMDNFKKNLVLMSAMSMMSNIMGPMAVRANQIEVSGTGTAVIASINNGTAELEKRAKSGKDKVASDLWNSMPRNSLSQKKQLIEAYNQRIIVQQQQDEKAQDIAREAGITLPDIGQGQALTALGMAMKIKTFETAGYAPPAASATTIAVAGHGNVYINAAYDELQRRTTTGDQLAKAVFDVYEPLMKQNIHLAEGAIKEYNRNHVLLTGGGGVGVHAPAGGGSGPLAADERTRLQDQIAALQARIRALEAQLRAAGGGGGPAAPTIQAIYDELKQYLENPTLTPVYRGGAQNLQDLLHNLVSEDNSDNAIDGFMKVIKDVITNTADRARQDRLAKAFTDLNQDGALRNYNYSLMKKQVRDTENNSIYPIGNALVSALSPQPDAAYLKTHPLLMLYYTDKSRGQGTIWQDENIEVYNNLAKSAPLEEVKAAYKIITKDWRKTYNPEDRTGSRIQSFLTTCYQRIVHNTPATPNSYTTVYISDFIDKKMRTDLKIDFSQLENDNIRNLKADYDRIMPHIATLQTEKPLMKALTYDLAAWERRDFSRPDYEKFIEYFKYLSTDELKSMLYHISHIHLPTQSASQHNTYFYTALNDEVLNRAPGFAPLNMTGVTKNLMENVINLPIAPLAPPRAPAKASGAGAPPPHPPPPPPAR